MTSQFPVIINMLIYVYVSLKQFKHKYLKVAADNLALILINTNLLWETRPGSATNQHPLGNLYSININSYTCYTICFVNMPFNTLRLRNNEQHFADNIFKHVFFKKNAWISKNTLKFVLNGPIDNIPALVQIMAWHRTGDKPLSEPMMVSLSTHISVTLPQLVSSVLNLNCHKISVHNYYCLIG